MQTATGMEVMEVMKEWATAVVVVVREEGVAAVMAMDALSAAVMAPERGWVVAAKAQETLQKTVQETAGGVVGREAAEAVVAATATVVKEGLETIQTEVVKGEVRVHQWECSAEF